jgi:uncharacterized protein YecT (DUF1311 family)
MQAVSMTRSSVELVLLLSLVLHLFPGRALAETPLEGCYAEAAKRIDVKPCLEARLTKAEASLHGAELAVEKEMQALGEITGRDDALRAFARANAEFVRFRQANCRWQRERAEPGTGAGDIELDCRVRMTEARAAELRESSLPDDAK